MHYLSNLIIAEETTLGEPHDLGTKEFDVVKIQATLQGQWRDVAQYNHEG